MEIFALRWSKVVRRTQAIQVNEESHFSAIDWGALSKEWPQWIVFFVLTIAMSFGSRGEALDGHWTTAWLILSGTTLFLAACRCITLIQPQLWAVGMLILFIQAFRGSHNSWEVLAQLGWFWTWLWTYPNPERFQWWKGVKALPMFALIIGTIMLLHAMSAMAQGTWGHTESYSMKLPWAHRNIGMESMFAMVVLGSLFSRRRWFAWWGFITLLALVYQVRGVLLGSACMIVYHLWSNRPELRTIRRGFTMILGLFVLVQVAWNSIPADERVEYFETVPDVLKSLDVAYNLRRAESSSIRTTMWSWTWDNLEVMGSGLAAWRSDAQGHVNVALNRCYEAQRRAHSEVLQWMYEIGWLPLLVLLGLLWPLRHSMIRWGWLVLPFLAFTFPIERAEILWPMAVLGWALKLRHPPELKTDERIAPRILVSSSVVGFALVVTWVIAQDAMGSVYRQTGGFKVKWSALQRQCLEVHPQDIVLNHATIYRSMSLLNAGKPEEGGALIESFLQENPRSISAIRIRKKMRGEDNDYGLICDELREKLAKEDRPEQTGRRPSQ